MVIPSHASRATDVAACPYNTLQHILQRASPTYLVGAGTCFDMDVSTVDPYLHAPMTLRRSLQNQCLRQHGNFGCVFMQGDKICVPFCEFLRLVAFILRADFVDFA